MCSCLKEKPPRTSFDPSGSQSGNQGGVNFKSAYKQIIEKIKHLDQTFTVAKYPKEAGTY